MNTLLLPLLATLSGLLRSRALLHVEILALRQQLAMVAERDRRRLRFRQRERLFNVTENPIALWTAQQMVEAFPLDTVPRYLLRDRDSVYGEQFRSRVKSLGIKEALAAPR